MNSKQKRNVLTRLRISFGVKIGLAISLLAVGVTTLNVYLFYSRTRDMVYKQTTERLADIGRTGAFLLDEEQREIIKRLSKTIEENALSFPPEKLKELSEGEAFDGLSPEVAAKLMSSTDFQTLIQTLRKIKAGTRQGVTPLGELEASSPDPTDPYKLEFTYIFIKLPEFSEYGVLHFIADADYDDPGSETPIGMAYVSDKDFLRAFNGDVQVSKEYYTDQWGTYISSSIPILDAEGKILGVLGLDLDVASEINQLNQLWNLCIMILGMSIVLSILLAYWIARLLSKPVAKLRAGAQEIQNGNLDVLIDIKSRNEFGDLADNFNQMSAQLKQRMEMLRASEENLRITLNSIGDCVITTDTEGRITGMNPAAEALVEQSLSETKGLHLSEVLPLFDSKTKESIHDITQEVLMSGITLNLPTKATLILPDGREKFIADSAAPIRNPDGEITGCVLTLRDITEKHQLETRLAQSQKMDALGQMAGGIAHDFNNMLTPILGAAQLLEKEELSTENRKKFTKMISTASQRAAELTQQMLTFSRKAPSSMEVIDLRDIVDESRAMLQHAIGSNISIQTQRPLQPMMTLGDASQIQNIFFNLALNARDAMPKTGTLSFQMKRVHLDAEHCRLHSHEIEPGSYIEVQISDTGEGVDPENLSKIFDPFFTTKEAGKGTGLGLASVYGVMKKHNGMVSVYSEKGHGTVFHLYFPEAQQTKTEKPEPPPDQPKGSPKVLLIDDDETVRNVTTALLENLGYTVLCAKSGAEGIDLYKTHQQEISLVMLDLVMPEMNGEDTFFNLRKINPDATVLIISGFDAEESVAGLIEAGAAGFLQKPFQLNPLAKALQRALAT